jgi:hypothetical protein
MAAGGGGAEEDVGMGGGEREREREERKLPSLPPTIRAPKVLFCTKSACSIRAWHSAGPPTMAASTALMVKTTAAAATAGIFMARGYLLQWVSWKWYEHVRDSGLALAGLRSGKMTKWTEKGESKAKHGGKT